MYKVKETDEYLKVYSKVYAGLFWTGFLLILLLVSVYMSFECVWVECNRQKPITTEIKSVKGKKSKSLENKKTEIYCYVTHFDFQNGIQTDSIPLSKIIRMDKGYRSSLDIRFGFAAHRNPTFILKDSLKYPLRQLSNTAFTPDLLSPSFKNFILNEEQSIDVWDWYMGFWGIVSGISLLGLLFLVLSGHYQVIYFDKINHTFCFKNYGFLSFKKEVVNWKDIRKIIYQDKKTIHKKGIFFMVRRKTNPTSEKYKLKKIYLTHHTDSASKSIAQKIADLIRPIAKPSKEIEASQSSE